MVKLKTKYPFRAEHVGSFLRPENLHKARKQFKEANISAEELYAIETKEIKNLVDKQIEVGLEVVTGGEFRRTWFHYDFMEHLNGFESFIPDQKFYFKNNVEIEQYGVKNTGKISFNANHPHIKDFIEFNKIVDGRAVAKQTIPSPNTFFSAGTQNKDIYPDIHDYAEDIIKTYQDAYQAFYDAGVRYLQLDDVYIAGLSSEENPFSDGTLSRQELIDLALHVVNESLANKPKDLIVTTHLCRGNYRSSHAFEGSYDLIAPTLLEKEKVDGFFLEYDDDRSGDFKALKYIPEGGPRVILGLITSKTGELEDRDRIIARIHEAARYLPLEQLCLSPQCGFASTHLGNEITEEEQWNKMKFVIDIAKEVWKN